MEPKTVLASRKGEKNLTLQKTYVENKENMLPKFRFPPPKKERTKQSNPGISVVLKWGWGNSEHKRIKI